MADLPKIQDTTGMASMLFNMRDLKNKSKNKEVWPNQWWLPGAGIIITIDDNKDQLSCQIQALKNSTL